MATVDFVKQLLTKYNVQFDESSDDILKVLAEFNQENLPKYIESCIFIHKELYNVAKNITIEQMYSIIAKSNKKMLKSLKDEFDKVVADTNLDPKSAKIAFKSISASVIDVSDRCDQEIIAICNDYMSNLEKIRTISQSFKKHLDTDIATKIYNNCLNRMQTFVLSTDTSNLKQVIYFCLNNLENGQTLSQSDLLSISKRCASFFSDSSYEKVSKISKSLQLFQYYIVEHLSKQKNEENQLQILQYSNEVNAKDLKNIFLTTPSIFTTNPATIEFNIELIKGRQSLGELLEKQNLKISKTDFQRFKNIRTSFELGDLASIYTSNLSTLTLSPNSLLSVLKHMDNTCKDIFGSDISPEEYINSQNYTQLSQIVSAAESHNLAKLSQWKNNLELLSGLVDKDKLKKYFLSNLKLANIPTDYLKEQISNTILSCDAQNLQASFDRLLDKNFFWDAKKSKSTDEPIAAVYRIGNKKNPPINFELSINRAKTYLQENGCSDAVLDAWENKPAQQQENHVQLDISTINTCNEVFNLMRKMNDLLTKRPLYMILVTMREDINYVRKTIAEISADTRNLNTSTKGVIVNLKNDFAALIDRYNQVVSERSQIAKDEFLAAKKEHEELKNLINQQLDNYLEYHNNVPQILKQRSYYISKQTELLDCLSKLQQQQEENRTTRLEPIISFSEQVQDYYEDICQTVEDCTNKYIILHNPANCQSSNKQDILEQNMEFFDQQIHLQQSGKLTGRVFVLLKKLRNSDYSAIFDDVRGDMQKIGIDIKTQVLHTQPENFHGDILSPNLIIKFLGPKYNNYNYNLIRDYNGILGSANRIYNQLSEKMQAVQNELSEVNLQLTLLDEKISSGYFHKRIALDKQEKLDELSKIKQEKSTRYQKLESLYIENENANE